MTQFKQLAIGMMVLGIGVYAQAGTSPASEAPAGFLIMSEAEVATHTETLRNLHGEARDAYRNAQYEQLRRRALEHGYRMPATPPWETHAAKTSPQDPPAAPSDAGPAAAAETRHAEMREKMQARRDAALSSTNAELERLKQAINAQQQQVETRVQPVQQEPQPPAPPAMAPAEATAGTEAAALSPSLPPLDLAPTATGAETADQTAVMPSAAAEAPPPTPQFAPVEEMPAMQATVEPPPAPETMPAPPGPFDAPIGSEADDSTDYGSTAAMNAYRESMRARFDEYMKERQAQHEENIRRQREQRAATMEQNRAQANRQRVQPYPYPTVPAYGPRYPAAYPGYRTPYWQQR